MIIFIIAIVFARGIVAGVVVLMGIVVVVAAAKGGGGTMSWLLPWRLFSFGLNRSSIS